MSDIVVYVFKAHSLRRAAASTSLMKGVQLSDFLSTPSWAKDSIFMQFLYRRFERVGR
jgi:hypothetical protein